MRGRRWLRAQAFIDLEFHARTKSSKARVSDAFGFALRGLNDRRASRRALLRTQPLQTCDSISTSERTPEAIFAHKVFDTDELAESLVKIGEWIARITASPAQAAYGTSRDLILKAPSRLGGPLLVATSLMASHQLIGCISFVSAAACIRARTPPAAAAQ
jgi:hypothetical protein